MSDREGFAAKLLRWPLVRRSRLDAALVALYDWQQTADEQEMELAELRGKAYAVVNSFDRKPTEGCVQDVIGLAESLRRYREMIHGRAVDRGPRPQRGVVPRG